MPELIDLDGASALVAGASGVFGGEMAKGLHHAGARLVLAGRDRQRLEARAAELGERKHIGEVERELDTISCEVFGERVVARSL